MKKMYGVNVPISTPMLENGEVDYKGLESLCEYLIEKGIHGLYPNGSTGEMCYLTLDERKKVLETVIATAKGRVNVFSMVGANTTRDTIELAKHAEAAGADGIGVVTPYYFKLDQEELLNYFADVAGSVSPDFPVYLYGIPQLAVNDITVALAQRIAEKCPNVVGIKYSFPDMPRLLDFMEVKDHTFSVLTGPDELFHCLMAAGGDGVISGNANVIPEHYVAVYDAWQKGDYALAGKIQAKINRMQKFISGPNHMSRYKVGLKHRGIISCAAMRRPLREITPEEEAAYLATIEAMDYTDPTKQL